MNARERRISIIGAAIVASALGAFRAVPAAVSWWARANDELGQEVLTLERLRASVTTVDAMSRSADSVRRAFVALDSVLLPGKSDAEAQAGLAAHVGLADDRARAALQQSVPIPDSATAGPLRRVTARVTLMGDSRGIVNAIAFAGEDPVTMVVRQIRIVAPDPGSPDDRPETLTAELLVSGWYLRQVKE